MENNPGIEKELIRYEKRLRRDKKVNEPYHPKYTEEFIQSLLALRKKELLEHYKEEKHKDE